MLSFDVAPAGCGLNPAFRSKPMPIQEFFGFQLDSNNLE
jgi:hypothetical protein